ncbi:hypothetical protein EHS25_004866 [Saitozyma podzolica]|uniref:Uncharacterized protein n=1 Tax=Saitozyma podzolica TaxID=1890683 RepID=A0A427Y2Z7_9TREE|nr:hypothetical protein EHS25_004866 [Saitozyma podzolica]
MAFGLADPLRMATWISISPPALSSGNPVPPPFLIPALALGLADQMETALMQTRTLPITPVTITSTFPDHIQTRYCYRPRHNTSLFDAQVFARLREHALLPIAPKVLPPGTDILIPSTQPDAGKTRPAYWVIKKSNLLTGDHVARILDAFARALEGAERTDGQSAFHAGAFLKPCASKSIPWVSMDTLQPPRSSGQVAQEQSMRRMAAMIDLCLAIDSVLNTRGQSTLKRHDPRTFTRSRRLHHAICTTSPQEAIDYGLLQCNPFPPGVFDDITRVLRFGNLGTCVAISRGQAEKLHLDLNDDNAIYTSVMVLGNPGDLWDSFRHQGHPYLPSLGLLLPMTIGDMVFFNASELPQACSQA